MPGTLLDGSLYPTPAINKQKQATLLVLLLLCLCNPFKDRLHNTTARIFSAKADAKVRQNSESAKFFRKKTHKNQNFFFHDKKDEKKRHCTLYYIYARGRDRGFFKLRITPIT